MSKNKEDKKSGIRKRAKKRSENTERTLKFRGSLRDKSVGTEFLFVFLLREFNLDKRGRG